MGGVGWGDFVGLLFCCYRRRPGLEPLRDTPWTALRQRLRLPTNDAVATAGETTADASKSGQRLAPKRSRWPASWATCLAFFPAVATASFFRSRNAAGARRPPGKGTAPDAARKNQESVRNHPKETVSNTSPYCACERHNSPSVRPLTGSTNPGAISANGFNTKACFSSGRGTANAPAPPQRSRRRK